MKSSKEMADSVFAIRDACIEKRTKRKLIIKRTAFVCSTACMFVLVFGAIKLTMPEMPSAPGSSIIGTTTTSTDAQTSSVTEDSGKLVTSAESAKTSAAITSAKAGATTAATSAETEETTASEQTDAETENSTETATADTPVTTTDDSNIITEEGSVETAPVAETTAAPTVTEAVNTSVTVSEVCWESSTRSPVQTTALPGIDRICNRFQSVEVNKTIYKISGYKANPDEIGELICTTDLISDDSLIRCNAQIYEFVTPDDSLLYPIIIKFEGYDGYWIYSRPS